MQNINKLLNNAHRTAIAKGLYSFITASMIILLTACSDSGSDDAVINTSDNNSAADSGSISGNIFNYATSTPVAGVLVRADDASAMSNADGSYTLENIPDAARVIVYADHSEFAEQVKVVAVSGTEKDIQLSMSLLPIDVAQEFDPTTALTLSDVNSSAQASIAGNSLVDANGELPTGNVLVKMTVIDPTQDSSVMPGNYATSLVGTSPIESLGALAVTFEDITSGNELDLADGQTATIRIPVQIKNGLPPTTYPLFYFDAKSALWVEQGVATLNAIGADAYYEGSVTHFTSWNAGMIYERVFISGCVVDAIGNSVANITVKSDGDDYSGSANAITDQEGNFRVAAKANSSVLVFASSAGKKTSTAKITTSSTDSSLSACLVLGAESLSIRLTWGESPLDLDSHLVAPSYHISFINLGSLVSGEFTQLDVDDVSSFGPEVITITRFISPGVYTYSVHNYSETFGPNMTESPVKVELNFNGTVTRFSPPSGEGTNVTWNVFSITVDAQGNASGPTTIGTFSSTSP